MPTGVWHSLRYWAKMFWSTTVSTVLSRRVSVVNLIQRGTATISGATTTGTFTYGTAITTSRSELHFLGQTQNASQSQRFAYVSTVGSTSTTVTRNESGAGMVTVVGLEIVSRHEDG